MDPELLQSLADANGMPIEHFDGYSVIGHPTDGPVTVAHPPGARVPRTSGGESPPIVERVPPMLARPTGAYAPPPASIATTPQQQQADRITRLMHTPGSTLATGLAAERQRQQRIAQDQGELDAQHAEYVRTHGELSDPDRFGIVTRTRPDGHTERVGPPEAFAREQEAQRIEQLRQTSTSAGTRTFPDGSSVTTDDQGRSLPLAIPGEVPRSWLAPTMEDDLRSGAREATALDQSMGAPPSVPQEPLAAPGVTSVPRSGPAPAPVSPAAPAAPRVGGARAGGRPAPAPMTLPGAIDQYAGTPQAQQGFDQTIAGLAAGSPLARREPDLVDRQQFLDQQTAAAGREDAIRQAAAERQAEHERQQIEQDRAHAMLGARAAYQNAVDRVASAHLDPSRWFRDQGVGGTIAATLAVALGALGQAFSGGDRNLALEEISQAIDRDIEAQGADIESGRAAADMQGNMIGIMRSEYGDRDAAREAARAAMLRQVALQTQAHTADLADDEARLHADQTRAQLEAAANEADNDAVTRELAWRQSAAQTARLEAQAAHEMRLAHPGGGVAAHAPHLTTPQWEAFNHALAGTGGDVERAARLSFPEEAITPELLSQLRAPTTDAQRSSLDALSQSLDTLERVSGEGADIPGVGLWDSRLPGPEGRRVRQEIENAVDLIARLRSGAAISDSEADRFTHILGASQMQTEDEFRNGLSIIRRELGARLGRVASGAEASDRDLADVGGEWVDE